MFSCRNTWNHLLINSCPLPFKSKKNKIKKCASQLLSRLLSRLPKFESHLDWLDSWLAKFESHWLDSTLDSQNLKVIFLILTLRSDTWLWLWLWLAKVESHGSSIQELAAEDELFEGAIWLSICKYKGLSARRFIFARHLIIIPKRMSGSQPALH
jgi:hypothetical protein